MLHDLALDDVDFGGHGIELDLQTRRRFINQVDCLIRQKAIGDVTLRQHRCCDYCPVGDPHAMVHFVTLF